MRATASYIDNIAFNSEDGKGIIYKNFTASNVTGWTSKIYKTVFSADINVHDDLAVQIDRKDV